VIQMPEVQTISFYDLSDIECFLDRYEPGLGRGFAEWAMCGEGRNTGHDSYLIVEFEWEDDQKKSTMLAKVASLTGWANGDSVTFWIT
jgi:hypothetical protein